MKILAIIVLSVWSSAALASSAVFTPENCLSAPYTRGDTEGRAQLVELLTNIRRLIAGFPSLETALDTRQPEICLSDKLVTEQGYYSPETNRVVLNRKMSPGLYQAVMLHELRHIDQHLVGACPSSDMSMQATARATFAMEADANAVALLVAWKARTEGDDAVWTALESWSSVADVTRAFEAEMLRGGDPAGAAAAAFGQWYAVDERREAYYIGACSDYLNRLEREHLNPVYGEVPPVFFPTLCRLPDGKDYDCDEPPEALPR